jgi:hypothetical protein
MIGTRMNDFDTVVMLLEPLIVPILRRVSLVQAGPHTPVATDVTDAGTVALWRWTVPVAGGELGVTVYFRDRDARIINLLVVYRGPVIGVPQFALASGVRKDIEERTGIHTDVDWQRTKRHQGPVTAQ